MASTRELLAKIYRPTGPKVVRQGIAWDNTGGSFQLAQGIDLSLPIRGLRFVFRGRLVIAGGAMAAVKPEGLLNLISRIVITGTNKRQNGNVTLLDMDLATLWVLQHLFERSAAYFEINGVSRAVPTTPFPAVGANGYLDGNNGTYDFRIAVDVPFHPFAAPAAVRHGFVVRQEEYADSLQLRINFGTQPNAAVAGCLGTGAAGTTYTFSQFGAAGGAPVIDIYSLPMEMGMELKDGILPGMLVRTQQPITTVLQAQGTGVVLLDLQKQRTTRVMFKVGTSASAAPSFDTLSDTNVTALGISLGGNRNVRDRVDVFAHKLTQQQQYGREPIQGYNVLDFLQSGNPDSAYPGNQIGNGASFQLVADVTGVANAFGLIVQEQEIFSPDGWLANPQ
jgi:hypothetical protein